MYTQMYLLVNSIDLEQSRRSLAIILFVTFVNILHSEHLAHLHLGADEFDELLAVLPDTLVDIEPPGGDRLVRHDLRKAGRQPLPTLNDTLNLPLLHIFNEIYM